MPKPANILQIADVVHGVVILLLLPCVRQYFAVKRVKCSAILFSLPKQLNLVPGFSRLTVQ